MAAGCERLRDRHGARWTLPLRPPLCLACAVETLGDGGASLVRKKHALSRLRDALAWQALPVVQLLAPDERGCLCLIGTLFGMCHAVEDSDTQDQFGEVLVQLIVELKSEQYLRCILDESQKELCKATTRRGSLPTFTLLGKLADAVPVFADILVVEHSNLVDHLLVGLMYPNEGVKAAVCYLYGKLYSSPVGTEKLSVHFEERLCGLFLNTFGQAQTKELQVNCLGLLKELLKSDRFVSILMDNSKPEEESENSDLLEGENPLPLILKKLLLSRDEMLQAASSHCMAAVLVHSPSRYAPAFIHADVPEFLFECLMCSSEILIWSVYCSLLLLTEERLFFSKCHTVYGIESLVRSLQHVLQLNNVELHKQGLLLFTEIVKSTTRVACRVWDPRTRGCRKVQECCIECICFPGPADIIVHHIASGFVPLGQPVEIKLFTNRGICINAIDVLMKTVDCPVLEVVVEAVKAVAAFLRVNSCYRCPRVEFLGNMDSYYSTLWKVSEMLAAVELQSDPMAQENAFTAPCSENKETLNNFSEFLLRICDSLCIPMVMNYLERAVSSSVMEVFISALNTLFTVVPNMRDKFSKKLASSCFIRLILELKARFCSVQSNPALNQACSSFLCNLCLSLYSTTEKERTSSQEEQEMSELLQKSLPQLNYTVAESLLLLAENPEPLSLDQSLCNHQHCFILLLYFAYTLGDRFVPETELFLAIRNFLLLAQDHRDCLPPYILRAVLYLLAVCQDKGKALDSRSLCTIKRILDNLPDLSLVYIHCPLLLKFFLHCPELMGRFGHQVLQLWFSWEDCNHMETEEAAFGTSDQLNNANPLLPILKSNSSILLILLDLVCSSSVEVAQKVLMTLRTFLEKNEDVFVCDLLRSQFLQILQQLLVESSSASLQANRNLPILLSLLFLVQLRNKGMRELDSTDFKLLHQVSNLCGKCRPKDIDLLQPSLNFLYCTLHQTTPCSQQRAVAVLLSNVSLLELLQKLLECTWMWSFPSEPTYLSSEDALLSSGWLLAASLLIYQHRYNTEVHQTLSVDLKQVLNAVIFRNKKPVLLLVSIVQFLRAILQQNFSSLLVTVVQNTAQGATQPQPLSLEDAALHPLTTQQVFSLVVSLQNLLVHVYLQKDLLLSQAVVACLETLLEYLYVRNQDVALHVASQPWHRFLLLTLLSGSQKSILQPEILRLMTLFLKYQSSNIISQKEIGQILQEVAEANLVELPEATSRALHLFLCQIQSSHCQVEPVQARTIQTLLEHLPQQTNTCAKHQDIVCVGSVTIALPQ
ncbi:meiosis inhibitor protein 1 isoform X4 [Gallus gallus]|uniref:meiosis inhibitor protein 1 isoform X4 n=1 Tax=Gallus gallus TaxID=9031 RepID=UPI001AE34088|nr:meiosis inhibitor protein 1 isoform X4 [Gallus gallus]